MDNQTRKLLYYYTREEASDPSTRRQEQKKNTTVLAGRLYLCFPSLFQSFMVGCAVGAEKSCYNFMKKVVTIFNQKLYNFRCKVVQHSAESCTTFFNPMWTTIGKHAFMLSQNSVLGMSFVTMKLWLSLLVCSKLKKVAATFNQKLLQLFSRSCEHVEKSLMRTAIKNAVMHGVTSKTLCEFFTKT